MVFNYFGIKENEKIIENFLILLNKFVNIFCEFLFFYINFMFYFYFEYLLNEKIDMRNLFLKKNCDILYINII